MLKTRILLGGLLIACFLGILLADHHFESTLGFTCLAALAVFLGIREFLRLSPGADVPAGPAALVAAGAAALLLCEWHFDATPRAWVTRAVVGAWVFCVCAWHVRRGPAHAASLVACLAAFAYVFVLVRFGWQMRQAPGIGEGAMILWISASKSTDCFALFGGKLMGRRKLAPTVSPNKTVEGALVGLAFGVAAGLVVWRLTALHAHFHAAWIVAASAAVSVSTVCGDLLESMLKRHAGVKDSGRMLPEFGGALDMLDGLILSAPVAWFFLSPMFSQAGVSP